MRQKGWRFLVLLTVFSLTACAAPEAPPRYPEITFAHLPPIKLDVAEIVYSPRYEPPVTSPHVGHEFPQPPAVAAERWIADRLQAVGNSGQARITVRQAAALETTLKKKSGLTGAFTTDQAWRYDARVEIAIDAANPNRRLQGQASAIAHQSRTVPEDASLAEREQVWFTLTENLMTQFNLAMETQIRKDLAKFVK